MKMTDRKKRLLAFVGVWAVAYTIGNIFAEHASFDLPGWTGFVGHILQFTMLVAAFFVQTKKALTIAINVVLAVT